MELFGLSPEGTTILAMGLAVTICLLLVLGVYFWIRKMLRVWVKQTGTSLDDQILVRSEDSLLPLVALGAVYLLFSFAPLPPEFVPTGKRILLAGIIVLALVVATRLLLLLLERLGAQYGVAKHIAHEWN